MVFFKKQHILRRYSVPVYIQGHALAPYTDIRLAMDVQTVKDAAKTDSDGTRSTQELKVFCDSPILAEDDGSQQKADRIWFQGKWFVCVNSRLSENTILRHYTATFVECLDKEAPPCNVNIISGSIDGGTGGNADDTGRGKKLPLPDD